MNLNYQNATLVARATELLIANRKDHFKRLTNILAGKNMGAATLDARYTPQKIQGMKDKLVELAAEIEQAEDFQRELRTEVARLAGSVEAPRGNGHARPAQ